MSTRLILTYLFGFAGAVALVALGTWQVQRLGWKNAVLAEIAERMDAAPVDLPVSADPEADKYLAVKMSGRITTDELHVLVSLKGLGPGYRVISAFETDTGRRILLDRGFIPTARKDAARPAAEVALAGNLHWPDETDGFTPAADRDANIWFARDVTLMSTALRTEPLMVVLRQTSETDAPVTPFPIDTAGIPNDHLGYAITWFSLAVVWMGMTAVVLRRMHRRRV